MQLAEKVMNNLAQQLDLHFSVINQLGTTGE